MTLHFFVLRPEFVPWPALTFFLRQDAGFSGFACKNAVHHASFQMLRHQLAGFLLSASDMRIQVVIIVFQVSLLLWGGSFFIARDLYHLAQETGVMPNLHLRHQLDEIL